MNLVLAARADHDTHRHANRDVGCVSIDNVGREFWAFFQMTSSVPGCDSNRKLPKKNSLRARRSEE